MFHNVEAYHRPRSVREALRLLQSGNGGARVIAGGTDGVAGEQRSVRILIDISGAGLRYIRRRGSNHTIGGATPLAELEESVILRDIAGGILSQAAGACGSPQNRNVATLGNIAYGSAAADLITALLVLDTVVVTAEPRGRHRVALTDYLAASRGADSLLVEVAIPALPNGQWSFQRFARTEPDLPVANAAAGLQLDSRGRVKWARLALGGAASVPFRASSVEELMRGRIFDRTLLAEAGGEVMRAVEPASDCRASAGYRRELSRVLMGRALEACAAQAGCSL